MEQLLPSQVILIGRSRGPSWLCFLLVVQREGRSFTLNRIFCQDVAVTIYYSSHYRSSQYTISEESRDLFSVGNSVYAVHVPYVCVHIFWKGRPRSRRAWLSGVMDCIEWSLASGQLVNMVSGGWLPPPRPYPYSVTSGSTYSYYASVFSAVKWVAVAL